jgi:5-methylcytosine-specific restriction endonuclease McrA
VPLIKKKPSTQKPSSGPTEAEFIAQIRSAAAKALTRITPEALARENRAAWARKNRRKAGIPAKVFSRLEGEKKLCLGCMEMRNLYWFPTSCRGLGGHGSYCRPCFKRRYGGNRERARKATASYRSRHKERARAAHRLHQFKRRTAQKAQSDGTVTDAAVAALYATEHCYYCMRSIEADYRTLEHKQPLSRGGLHSIANVAMACRECNSAKRNMTEEEFRREYNYH